MNEILNSLLFTQILFFKALRNVPIFNLLDTNIFIGARGNVVVKALCYKPEDRGFDTRWGELIFSKFT
jgi:hypothetical protein